MFEFDGDRIEMSMVGFGVFQKKKLHDVRLHQPLKFINFNLEIYLSFYKKKSMDETYTWFDMKSKWKKKVKGKKNNKK